MSCGHKKIVVHRAGSRHESLADYSCVCGSIEVCPVCFPDAIRLVTVIATGEAIESIREQQRAVREHRLV